MGRAAVETGHSVLFTSATALLAALAKAETEGQLAERLTYYTKSDARSSIEPLKLPGSTVLSSFWTQQPVKRQLYFSTSGIFSWTQLRSRSSTLPWMRLPPREVVCDLA